MTVPDVPKWVISWVPPAGWVTQAALGSLDRPLLACTKGDFDADDY